MKEIDRFVEEAFEGTKGDLEIVDPGIHLFDYSEALRVTHVDSSDLQRDAVFSVVLLVRRKLAEGGYYLARRILRGVTVYESGVEDGDVFFNYSNREGKPPLLSSPVNKIFSKVKRFRDDDRAIGWLKKAVYIELGKCLSALKKGGFEVVGAEEQDFREGGLLDETDPYCEDY